MIQNILTPEQLQADTDKEGKTTTMQSHAVNVTALHYLRKYLGDCAADYLLTLRKVYTTAPIAYEPTLSYQQGDLVQKGDVVLVAKRSIPVGVAFTVGDFYEQDSLFEDPIVSNWWVNYLRKAISHAVKYKLLPTTTTNEHGGGFNMPTGGGNIIVSARAMEQSRQVYIDVAESFAVEAMRELKDLNDTQAQDTPIAKLYAAKNTVGCGCGSGGNCNSCGTYSRAKPTNSPPLGFG